MSFQLEDDLMEAARGLPSNTVCRLLEKHLRTVNFRGLGKRDIFESLVRHHLSEEARDRWLPTFSRQLRNEPRPKKRSERKREKARAEAARAAERQREADEFVAKGGDYDEAIAQAEYQRDLMMQARAQLSAAAAKRRRLLRIARSLDPKRYITESWPLEETR